MAILGTGQIAKLVAAFVEGDDNLIVKLVEKKLESLGEDVLMSLIGGPLGTAQRISKALETGGASEFERLRNEWLNKARPANLPYSGALRRLQGLLGGERKAGGPRGKWTHSQWASSREQWLNDKWRHDWRSQPRDPATGRWVPGRLDYVAANLQYRGTKAGRTVRTFRRKRRARRAAARKLARQMMERDGD